MPIINKIEIKHYDLTNAPTVEINIDKNLINFFNTIEKICNEYGYTIDEFICSLLENEINKQKECEEMTMKDILDANIQC